MVSPGTHLVKIHESQFTTIESQFKNKSPGSLYNHTVNLKTDSKTLYYSLLNYEYTPSIVKHNKEKKKFVSLNNNHKNNHRNHTNRTFFKNILRSINLSLRLTGRIPQIILCLWGFLCIKDAGCRGDKITALSIHLIFSTTQKSVQKKTQIRIHLTQLAYNQKSGSTIISVASHADLLRALSNARS